MPAASDFVNTNSKGFEMKLRVGTQAPDFAAKDMDGKEINISNLTKNGPSVLIFLRGFS